ncbi:MAG: THUMP domain-containing protein [bacterium]
MSTATFKMTAKTLFGLEQVLADELHGLGAGDIVPGHCAVAFTGDNATMYRANLWCRTATRIVKPIRTFNVRSSDDLYHRVAGLNWSTYLGPDSTFAVDALAAHSRVTNSLYAAQKTKDAIVDQIRQRTGRRPSVSTTDPDLRINLHLMNDRATLSLDSSGGPLHRRGYRLESGSAPLNEVLAAGIIGLTGWDRKASFVDPMCGSGTIVIEAALAARSIAPGLLREKFGFMRFPDFDAALWKSLRAEARTRIEPPGSVLLSGSDIDPAAIEISRANAARAGVADSVSFSVAAFDKAVPLPAPGMLVTNPPYDQRQQSDDMSGLYRSFGDSLKRQFSGYRAFVLTGYPDAAKVLGLRTKSRTRLYNPPLECRLLEYELYQGSRKRTADQP